ncbi:MAG: 3-to-5 oligoribonuclease [Evtepia sp.]|jgi:phosphoesterase RecJ-like protein|nr:3-to-5 oligoribonuclease [Evtepia sp.]
MDYRQTADLLREQDGFLILTHRRPDGDTIGSAAALCLGLRQLGKTAYVFPNEEAHDLFTPYLEPVMSPKDFIPQFIVAVDTASLELLPDNAKIYQLSIDLSIDHHGSNTNYAKKTCVVSSHAACGELIYLILKELAPISSDVSLLLYVAISTDTGCFSYSNTTAETHSISAALIKIGCKHQWVNKRHFRTKSLPRLRLESLLIQEMILLNEGKTAIASISLELVSDLGATEEDLENITAFLEQVQGVEHAVTIRELHPGEYKISLRTGASLNASAVCALLGGGGHPAAAGCTVFGTLDTAKGNVIRAISEIQNINP